MIDRKTRRELEMALQHLLREIHRDHLQAIVGCLEARRCKAPKGDAGSCQRTLTGEGGEGFFTASAFEFTLLRGFLRRSGGMMGWASFEKDGPSKGASENGHPNGDQRCCDP